MYVPFIMYDFQKAVEINRGNILS